MRALGKVIALLLLVLPALGQEKPARPDTPGQAAEKVLAAFRAKDEAALKALAAEDDPDPWLVAEELLGRGRSDVALAFAEAAPRKDTEALPGYVREAAGLKVDPLDRQAVERAWRLAKAGKGEESLAALAEVKGDLSGVLTVRRATCEGRALQALRRTSDSLSAFEGASRRAEQLGWLTYAAALSRAAGLVAYRASDFRKAIRCFERCASLHLARGKRVSWAVSVMNLGVMHDGLGEYRAAVEHHRKALPVLEEAGGKLQVAQALGNLGNSLMYLGEWEESLSTQIRALRLNEQLDRTASVARTLGNIGLVYQQRGDFDKALEYLGRSLEMNEQLDNKAGIGRTLGNIGLIHETRGNYEEARRCHQRCLDLARELENPSEIARALGNLGLVENSLGNLDRALQLLSEAVTRNRDLGNRAVAAKMLGNIGVVHWRRGDYLKAREVQREALTVKRLIGDRPGIVDSLANLGLICTDLGDYPGALEHFRDGLALSEQLGRRDGIAQILGMMGVVHWRLGNLSRALDLFERSMELHEKMGNRVGVAQSLGNMGSVYLDQGEHLRSLDFRRRALEELERLENRVMAATALKSLGETYWHLGDFPRALECHQRALARRRQLQDRSGEASSLGSLALLHASLGDYQKSIEHHAAALRIREELGERDAMAVSLMNIGCRHLQMGNSKEALVWLERALEIQQATGNRQGQAATLGNICYACRALGDLDRARECAEESLRLAEQVGIFRTVFIAELHLADIELDLNHLPSAVRLVRSAVERICSMGLGFPAEQGAMARERWIEAFATGLRAAIACRSARDVAFFLESGRALTLLESLRGGRALREEVLTAEVREEEAGARAGEAVALAAYRAATDEAARTERREELDAAREKVRVIVERIQLEAGLAAEFLYPRPAELEAIQEALREGEALVEYGLYEDVGVALLLTRDRADLVALADPSKIADLCAKLVAPGGEGVRGLGIPRSEAQREALVAEAARELAAAVLEPLGLDEDTNRLLVSPHGELAYVPFCLLDPGREVACLPSGTALVRLRAAVRERGEKVLALGDPGREGLVDPRTGEELPPLRGAEREARAVGDIVLLGEDASETRFRAAVAQGGVWRAVHFACHGLVDPERPMRSGLILHADGKNDGLLTALDLFRVRIRGDLAVLSACETARGKVYRSEGVVGLANAFMVSGAPRVLCSLWKVDDAATRALMVRFYELWDPSPETGRPPLPAAKALKQAQEFVRSHEKWKHPYFWAAWVLWGLPD